jgi:hypothetical protein
MSLPHAAIHNSASEAEWIESHTTLVDPLKRRVIPLMSTAGPIPSGPKESSQGTWIDIRQTQGRAGVT